MLSVIQNATACATNLTVPFSGVGGVPPYSYAVAPGGAGGSINSSGLYTSPSDTGTDTIVVTDSTLATADASIFVGTPLELFCDVISTYMGLSQGQVYLWDQKINIPTDSRLYIAVAMLSCKVFGNDIVNNGSGGGFNTLQSTNIAAQLNVDIFSRGPDARDLKEQVILALNSVYSEQQQELNSFRIFPNSTAFRNLSEIDGAAIPYRYQIDVQMQYFVSTVTDVNYYSTFETPSVLAND